MPLSEHEQKMLEQLEKQLHEEDPKFADSMGADALRRFSTRHIVLGILANKDAETIVLALRPHARSLTFVPVPDHAHHDPAELARRFGGRAAASVEEALAELAEPRLVAGSLYLAGAVLAANGEVPA